MPSSAYVPGQEGQHLPVNPNTGGHVGTTVPPAAFPGEGSPLGADATKLQGPGSGNQTLFDGK